MSDSFEELRDLALALSVEAERLPALHAEGPDWHLALEPQYRALERLMQGASPELRERLFRDARIRAAEAGLQRLRAAYEFAKEMARARAILDSPQPAARLAGFMAEELHWALGPELRAALQDCRRVLVAGSGPLPLTALAIAAETDAAVTAQERDPEAFALAGDVIALAGFGDRVDGLQVDLVDLENLERYDAIVGAVLLGVEPQGTPFDSKAALLRSVVARIGPATKLILREPHGIGRLFYPPADFGEDGDLALSRHAPDSGPEVPYRSGLIVLCRPEAKERHAEPSALPLHP